MAADSIPQWGVPDWPRAQDYPHPQGPGATLVWAWEFLRRNEDYRNFWLTKAGPLISTGRPPLWPSRETQEKFGIQDPCDPRQNSCIPTFTDLGIAFLPSPVVSYEVLPNSSGPPSPLGFVRASRANLSKKRG